MANETGRPLIRFDIVSAVPQTFGSVIQSSILGRAQTTGLAEIVVHNLHDYGIGHYRQVDDTPYGGGAGMILRPEPVFACIEKLKSEREYDDVIYLTPDGELFDQHAANRMSLQKNLVLLCGHYKGIDERIREQLVTREISIGNFVLTGGEIPAMVIADAVIRLLPGALGDSESALNDSFQYGLLDPPHYTRPAEFRGARVPDVLVGGDHTAVERWREEMSYERTRARHPELLADAPREQVRK